MPVNVSVFSPGADVTAHATAPVLAKRLVGISGDRAGGGNIAVAHAPTGTRAFGVARDDTPAGSILAISRGASRIVTVKAEAVIAANADVQVGTAGQVITRTTGVVVGYAVTGAAAGADAQISLV